MRMGKEQTMGEMTVLILGEYRAHDPVHRATRDAVLHAAEDSALLVNTRWMGPEALALYPGIIAESRAVILAPPVLPEAHSAYKPLLAALRSVREGQIPFLATGSAHGYVFIEVARNLLGMMDAGATNWPDEVADPVVSEIAPKIDALRDDPLEIAVEYLPLPQLESLGLPERANEPSDLHLGLNPDYAHAMADAGFVEAAISPEDRRPQLYLLQDCPFHLSAAFLPQCRSRSGAPHPLFSGLIRTAAERGEAHA